MSTIRSNLADLPRVLPRENAPALRGRNRECEAAASSFPPVVLIGGDANALSVARELGRQGISVFGIGTEPSSVRHSRYCQWLRLPEGDGGDSRLASFLLGPEAAFLDGAVLLACCDAGIEVVARHRGELLRRYRLDLAHPPAQVAMLDKLRTYEIASAAGVATPKFWNVDSREQLQSLRDELRFPLMIKPRLSHLFERHFGKKYMVAETIDEVVKVLDIAAEAQIRLILVELIPGGDDRLCSYFTFIDETGEPLCHFTKRVIRRYPVGMGAGCYHITGEVPEIVEPSLRLIKQAGLLGLANVEFKFDERDGRQKLIECNGRFVASNALVAASGLRLASFVYGRAIGRPVALSPRCKSKVMRQWDPLRDFAAFLQLRRRGEITFVQWLQSIGHLQTFPYLSWTDPGPTLSRLGKRFRRSVSPTSMKP
jgi:D-aspartate ligase